VYAVFRTSDREEKVSLLASNAVTRWRAGASAITVVIGLLVGILSPLAGHRAQAEPVPPAAGNGSAFSLFDMGVVAPLAFYGDQGSAELTFPVSRGLIPQALNARVELPVNVRSGLVTVRQKERTIARVPLPPTDQGLFTIPLAGVAVEDNAVSVTLRTSLVAAEGYCLDPTDPLRLVDGSVTFGGSEAPPAAVAEFLPPILRKLTIAIPGAPSTA
jgi:hypothetical protein